MKLLLPFLFAILAFPAHAGDDIDSLVSRLDVALHYKTEYAKRKMHLIDSIQTAEFATVEKNRQLYFQYKKFQLDSAIKYVLLNLRQFRSRPQTAEHIEAEIWLAGLYSSSGKPIESQQLLNSVHRSTIPVRLLPLYYETQLRFYEQYAANAPDNNYNAQITTYRDSLLAVLPAGSADQQLAHAERAIQLGQYEQARQSLLKLLPGLTMNDGHYAMTTYLLGTVHQRMGDREAQRRYFALSATADIMNAVKDNASLRQLSLIYLDDGDIDRSYAYMKAAIDDAIFANVHFRTINTSGFFSLINTLYLEKEASRKKQLQAYLLIISLLTFSLMVAIIYVYVQMRRLSRIRKELVVASGKLSSLNEQITKANTELKTSNSQLIESNRIKEEYIAHFFDLCSTYINKLENYRKTLNKKATGKQLNELVEMLRSTTVVENELEELYQNFDSIFLNLYPGFVSDFNALLLKEERIILKPGELLNTELRIFALIRLGITDSVKIAAFLRYSLSTIYNYRTRVRNKAAISRDEFEKRVMTIGTIASNAV